MALFTKKTDAKGVVRYRNVTENKPVKLDDLDEALVARLEVAKEGVKVNDDPNITDDAGEPNVVDDGVEKRTIRLTRPLLVNGVVFKSGKDIEVPADQADDLLRIDREHGEYEASLVKSQDKTRTSDVRYQDVQ